MGQDRGRERPTLHRSPARVRIVITSLTLNGIEWVLDSSILSGPTRRQYKYIYSSIIRVRVGLYHACAGGSCHIVELPRSTACPPRASHFTFPPHTSVGHGRPVGSSAESKAEAGVSRPFAPHSGMGAHSVAAGSVLQQSGRRPDRGDRPLTFPGVPRG